MNSQNDSQINDIELYRMRQALRNKNITINGYIKSILQIEKDLQPRQYFPAYVSVKKLIETIHPNYARKRRKNILGNILFPVSIAGMTAVNIVLFKNDALLKYFMLATEGALISSFLFFVYIQVNNLDIVADAAEGDIGSLKNKIDSIIRKITTNKTVFSAINHTGKLGLLLTAVEPLCTDTELEQIRIPKLFYKYCIDCLRMKTHSSWMPITAIASIATTIFSSTLIYVDTDIQYLTYVLGLLTAFICLIIAGEISWTENPAYNFNINSLIDFSADSHRIDIAPAPTPVTISANTTNRTNIATQNHISLPNTTEATQMENTDGRIKRVSFQVP